MLRQTSDMLMSRRGLRILSHLYRSVSLHLESSTCSCMTCNTSYAAVSYDVPHIQLIYRAIQMAEDLDRSVSLYLQSAAACAARHTILQQITYLMPYICMCCKSFHSEHSYMYCTSSVHPPPFLGVVNDMQHSSTHRVCLSYDMEERVSHDTHSTLNISWRRCAVWAAVLHVMSRHCVCCLSAAGGCGGIL